MKRAIFSTIFFILLISINYGALGDVLEHEFEKANELYAKGHYSSAAEIFEKIIEQGGSSPELYFNLANSYFKLKKFPHSLLYYERAKRLAPHDEDILFNISVANLQIVDKIEPVPAFFLYEWLSALESAYSSESWAIFATFWLWILFVSLAVFFYFWQSFVKRASFAIALLALLFSASCIFFAIRSNERENLRDTAIIFSPSVYVKSSPDEGGADLFLLHEGTKIKIEDSVNEWSRIKIANGSVGWIKKHDFVLI